jgi:hypothetical protein
MRIRTPIRTLIRTRNRITRVDTLFSYQTENRIAIRFAANRTGNRIRVDGPLIC